MLKQLFKTFPRVVQHNQAVAGISAGTPQIVSLVPAESRRQSVPASQKIDGAGLSVVLRHYAAARPLCRRELPVGLDRLIHNLCPPKLIGIPLRQNRPGVAVL